MAEVNISEAARLAQKGRSTIQRYIKDGKLSCGKDAQGNPVIDTAELVRVFGKLHTPESASNAAESQIDTNQIILTLQKQLEAAKEREDWLQGQLTREQKRYEELEQRMLPAAAPAAVAESEAEPAKPKGFLSRLFSG